MYTLSLENKLDIPTINCYHLMTFSSHMILLIYVIVIIITTLNQYYFFRGDMSGGTGCLFLFNNILPRYQPWRTQSRLTLVSIAIWDSLQNPPSMCPPASFLLQSGKSGRCPRRRCWTRHLPNTRRPIKGLAKHTKC